MNRIKLFFFTFLLIIIYFSLYNKPEEHKILLDESKNIQSIQTYSNGIFYYKTNNNIIKILPNSYLTFNNEQKLYLNSGIIIHLKNKYIKDYKPDISYTILLKNENGSVQFFRMEIPVNDHFTYKGKIVYHLDKKDEILDIKLHYLFTEKNKKYYGFFIPLNLYWEVKSYDIDLELYKMKKKYATIKTNHLVQKVEREEQVIVFRKRKSQQLVSTDYSLFYQQKAKRKKIWDENNSRNFMKNGYNYPLLNCEYLTSEFGLKRVWKLSNGKVYMNNVHTGVDYSQKKGTEVYAAADGIVRYAEFGELIGNTVILEHGLSFYSDYSHLDKIYVRAGQRVKKGDVIGVVGMTGASTGTHLHWGARVNGFLVDPRSFFDIDNIFNP